LAAAPIRRIIDITGLAALAGYLAIAALSYLQAPALWAPYFAPNATAFFTQLYGQQGLADIRAFFDGPAMILITRGIPVLIVSIAAILVLVVVARNPRAAGSEIADRIKLWALIFAGVCFFAYPVFTQDFWLSAVWGDMAASGLNPYHQAFTAEMLKPLPLDHFPMTMSYGPLWALISAAVMTMAGGSILAAALIFKTLLLGAWIASLFLIDRLISHIAPTRRALTLVVAGWVPLGVLETVAEGHNDIALILPALLWLALMLREKMGAPLALVASVMCKYVTAPLFLVDLIHSHRSKGMTIGGYVLRMILPALAGLAILAVFYRSFAFFDGVRLVDSWHFMRPADAFLTLGHVTGDWIEPVSFVFLALFPAIALYQCWRYWNSPDNETMLKATLAIMCAVSLSMIGHLWPWYLVWTLPLAALIPSWWLARFMIGLALFAPFTAVVWWLPEVETFKNEGALVMYLAAILWAYVSGIATSRVAAEDAETAPRSARLIDFIRARNKASVSHPRPADHGFEREMPVTTKAASGEN